MKFYHDTLILTLCLLALSCQTSRANNPAVLPGVPAKEVAEIQSAVAAGKDHPGKAVYVKYCLVCHQGNGTGVPGMYPPLTKGSWAGRDPKELVPILTKGLSGKVEVNDEVYKSVMPAQEQLTDQEIADVLSYIRSNFGNSFPPVSAATVKKIRSGK